jgi:hypothetical protein
MKLLREILRALELRRRLGDAEDPEAGRAERVHDAAASGASGPTTVSATGSLTANSRDRDRRAGNVGDARLARRAPVAGRHEHFRDARRLRHLPCKRMLASTAADDENVHARGAFGSLYSR